jgi:hypothetical protein
MFIVVLCSFAVVIELTGVNSNLTLPLTMLVANVPKDTLVKLSPYCTKVDVVPLCSIDISVK